MVDFENVFHMGIIVPNIETGMQEIASRFGVTWAEPIKPAVVPIVRTKEGIHASSTPQKALPGLSLLKQYREQFGLLKHQIFTTSAHL